jgi:transposase InsO family protein
VDLLDEIQRRTLESPSYGLPRITAELKRRGWEVNHKRVYRIMREDKLPVPAPAKIRSDAQWRLPLLGVKLCGRAQHSHCALLIVRDEFRCGLEASLVR